MCIACRRDAFIDDSLVGAYIVHVTAKAGLKDHLWMAGRSADDNKFAPALVKTPLRRGFVFSSHVKSQTETLPRCWQQCTAGQPKTTGSVSACETSGRKCPLRRIRSRSWRRHRHFSAPALSPRGGTDSVATGKFGLFRHRQGGEVVFPSRAEIDVPAPEPSGKRLRRGVIFRSHGAIGATFFGHGRRPNFFAQPHIFSPLRCALPEVVIADNPVPAGQIVSPTTGSICGRHRKSRAPA